MSIMTCDRCDVALSCPEVSVTITSNRDSQIGTDFTIDRQEWQGGKQEIWGTYVGANAVDMQ